MRMRVYSCKLIINNYYFCGANMVVYRGSSDVLLNFQVNVRLMKELKHLNAFVRDTVSVAEKELSESVYRKKRGNHYSYNNIAFQVGEMKCVSSYPNTYLSLRHAPKGWY